MSTFAVIWVVVFGFMVVGAVLGWLLVRVPPSDPPSPVDVAAVEAQARRVEFAPDTPSVVTAKPRPDTVLVHLTNEQGRPLGSITLHKIRRRPTFQYRTPKDGKLGNFLCTHAHSDREFTYRRVSVERGA